MAEPNDMDGIAQWNNCAIPAGEW